MQNSSSVLGSLIGVAVAIGIGIGIFGWSCRSKENAEFIKSVESGDLQKVAEMLTNSPKLINARNKQGRAALTISVLRRDLEMMKLLLAKGADVNVRDNDTRGFTPLHWSASGGYLDCAELLLANFADIHAKTHAGWCSLYYALRLDGNSPMNKEMAELLYFHKADVNIRYEGGRTLLHFAAMKTRPEALKWLLAKGADPTAKSNEGETPLDYALKWGNQESLGVLRRESTEKLPTDDKTEK